MPYRIVFRRSARKAFLALPDAMRQRVGHAIDGLSTNPRPPGARAVQGQDNLLRIRVGDYRVIYSVRDDALVILVIRVGHRRDVYRGL
jgi:mRNA interferase RelE/StbE